MDLKTLKLDIDELINEFSQCGSNALAEFKTVWVSKKFSYIYEACPSTNQSFFMQSLYAYCIGYIVSAGSLAKRLGGLYCMYCLRETQPFKPPYKIYLSLGELRQIRNLVVDAKANNMKVVSALLNSMLERNVFLFGFVGVNEASATERVIELTDIQNARVQAAYKKLFADSRLEHFIHLDMDKELDVDVFKNKSLDYAVAKEFAIKEASRVIDMENVKHIATKEELIGDKVEKIAMDWNSQKGLLYEQTGFTHPPHQDSDNNSHIENRNIGQNEPFDSLGKCDGNKNVEMQDDPDDFGKELEEALLFEPFAFHDEVPEPVDSMEENENFDDMRRLH